MYSFASPLLFSLIFIALFLGTSTASILLTDQPTIATFFPEASFAGPVFPIRGIYSACYNFHGLVGSLGLAAETQSCFLYEESDCRGGRDGPRIVFAPTKQLGDGTMGRGTGRSVRSLKCFAAKRAVEKGEDDE